MITRIVKMEFKDTFTEEFITIFKAVQPKIENTPGCNGVSLLSVPDQPAIFFTISKWDDEKALNEYRNSDLFLETWSIVKPNFNAKAEAWSLNTL